jgi:hypothetical protein
VIPPQSTPVSNAFFGATIRYLVEDQNGRSSDLTPFPPFSVSTFRFWDVDQWSAIEPSEGVFNWSKMDQEIAIAQRNGVSDFIFTFGRIPLWASTAPTTSCAEAVGSCAPPDQQAFDTFVATLVQRYCGTIEYFETWNEPNRPPWWSGTNSQLLTVAQHLYQIARDPANCGCTNGVCAPNGGVNPNKVLLPSISTLQTSYLAWLDSYLATAGAEYPYADVAAFHGYDEPNPENIIADVALFRKVMAKHGLSSLELWATEADWGEEATPVDQDQASWLLRYNASLVASGVSRFIWYAYDSCSFGTLWTTQACKGTQGPSDVLTAPGAASQVIRNWLTGATLTQCTTYQNGLWMCELQRPGTYDAWMLWSATSTTISVPIPTDSGLTVYRDWQDNVSALPTQLTVSKMPVLLESEDLAQL